MTQYFSQVSRYRLTKTACSSLLFLQASTNLYAELTDGIGPDVIFICTGAPEPFSEAISLVRKGGQIFLLGLPIQPVEADFFSVVMGELSIEGSLAGWAEFPAAIDLIAQGRVDVEALISHEVPLDEVPEWFGRLSAPGSGAVKVLVRME